MHNSAAATPAGPRTMEAERYVCASVWCVCVSECVLVRQPPAFVFALARQGRKEDLAIDGSQREAE